MLHIVVFWYDSSLACVPKTLKASVSTLALSLASRSDAIFIAASKDHPNPDVGVNKVWNRVLPIPVLNYLWLYIHIDLSLCAYSACPSNSVVIGPEHGISFILHS